MFTGLPPNKLVCYSVKYSLTLPQCMQPIVQYMGGTFPAVPARPLSRPLVFLKK
jgi:hypothetical protein